MDRTARNDGKSMYEIMPGPVNTTRYRLVQAKLQSMHISSHLTESHSKRFAYDINYAYLT